MILRNIVFVACAILLISCGADKSTVAGETNDLQFSKAKDGKEYADLILKALRTNRDKIVAGQFAKSDSINTFSLNETVSAYSQSIGKGDWDYVDEFAEAKNKNASNGYDYTWHDKRGRVAIQINILPANTNNKFWLKRLQFRSRMDVLESKAFPGGDIENYVKPRK